MMKLHEGVSCCKFVEGASILLLAAPNLCFLNSSDPGDQICSRSIGALSCVSFQLL